MRASCSLVLLWAACGGLDPIPLAGYRAAAEDALCGWAVSCRHVPDDATCRRLIDPKRYDTRRAAESVAAGRLVYDGEAAAACLDTGRRGACPASFDDPSCAKVFRGQMAEGGDCTAALECAGGAGCESTACDGACCLGRCGAAPAPLPPLAAVGASCETHFDCVAVAYCDAGICRELPRDEGDPCRFGCWYGDLRCDVATLRCQRLAGAAEACADRPCDEAWAFCDGVCRPRPGAGEACDDGARRCIPSTWCDGERCRPRGGEGAACAGDEQCEVACDATAGRCMAYAACQKLAPAEGPP